MIQAIAEPVVWATQFAILVALGFILRMTITSYQAVMEARKEMADRIVLFASIKAGLDMNKEAISAVHVQINSRMDQLLLAATGIARQEGKVEGKSDKAEAKENSDQIVQAIVESRPPAKDNADQIVRAIDELKPNKPSVKGD